MLPGHLENLVETSVALTEASALLAYELEFLLTGMEALPVAGALVPGAAIVLTLGALMPSSALKF